MDTTKTFVATIYLKQQPRAYRASGQNSMGPMVAACVKALFPAATAGRPLKVKGLVFRTNINRLLFMLF
jgi:hypothetical protein